MAATTQWSTVWIVGTSLKPDLCLSITATPLLHRRRRADKDAKK